jgi:hypothetical protein
MTAPKPLDPKADARVVAGPGAPADTFFATVGGRDRERAIHTVPAEAALPADEATGATQDRQVPQTPPRAAASPADAAVADARVSVNEASVWEATGADEDAPQRG